MKAADPIVFLELPVIQKIIDDETWLEGERRGCFVSRNDPVVVENVCAVILRIGRQLRESFSNHPFVTATRHDNEHPMAA